MPDDYFYGVDHSIFEVAGRGDMTEMESILSQNPEFINMKTINGNFTPLMSAISNYDMSNLIISRGADVNSQDDTGTTSLMFAIFLNRYATAELLIAHGADVNARDIMDRTALMFAAQAGRKDLVELLIAHGADVNAKCDKDDVLIDLVTSGNAEAKAKNDGGWTALMFAEAGVHSDIVDLLRRHGARDMLSGVRSPLTEAVINGDLKTVELLLSNGVDANAKDKLEHRPLYLAVMKHRKDIIELLISHGADLDAGSGLHKHTALQYAVIHRNIDLVEFLISNGANLNAKDKYGMTSLICAATQVHHNDDIVKLLISHGADVNIRDGIGTSTLMLAVQSGKKELVEFLISHGADLNAKYERDNAFIDTDSPSVEKPKRKAKCDDGWTALMIAEAKGHTDIADLLRKHGAKE
jgi:ankyrin repeat protein